MVIDNSMAQAFRTCPWMYYEQYLRGGKGIQPNDKDKEGYSSLDLGGRVHELLEETYKYLKEWPENPKEELVLCPRHTDEKLENEAQWMLEAYLQHWPNDNWEVIDVEQTFKIELPNLCPRCLAPMQEKFNNGNGGWICEEHELVLRRPHIYVGKLDLFVRDRSDGKYWIIDHKTEKRGSKSHIPQKLGISDQGSLYLWAAKKIYPQVDGMLYNILTRPSPAGKEPPTFPDRYLIERSEHDIDIAVRDLIVVANQIEEFTRLFGDKEWPSNRQECYGFGYCDYYQLHRFGEDPSEIIKHKFKPREDYLNLDGVEVTHDRRA